MTAADSAELRLLVSTAADVFRDCAERLPGDGWRLVHEAGRLAAGGGRGGPGRG